MAEGDLILNADGDLIIIDSGDLAASCNCCVTGAWTLYRVGVACVLPSTVSWKSVSTAELVKSQSETPDDPHDGSWFQLPNRPCHAYFWVGPGVSAPIVDPTFTINFTKCCTCSACNVRRVCCVSPSSYAKVHFTLGEENPATVESAFQAACIAYVRSLAGASYELPNRGCFFETWIGEPGDQILEEEPSDFAFSHTEWWGTTNCSVKLTVFRPSTIGHPAYLGGWLFKIEIHEWYFDDDDMVWRTGDTSVGPSMVFIGNYVGGGVFWPDAPQVFVGWGYDPFDGGYSLDTDECCEVEYSGVMIGSGGPGEYSFTSATSITIEIIDNKCCYWNGTIAPAYSSGTTYSLGDIVSSSGHAYRSIQNSNLNHAPSTSPSWWELLGATPCTNTPDETCPDDDCEEVGI